MTTYEKFSMLDLLTFNIVNIDKLTETYRLSFYSEYLTKWSEYAIIAKHYHSHCPMGYILGKAEGVRDKWHSHVSAITVGEPFRKLGIARTLMKCFEDVSRQQKANFADLFVRPSNALAIQMYKNLGYSIYRRVLSYYFDPKGSSEDAIEMRKVIVGTDCLLVPPKDPVSIDELDWP
mmetsp:Transcript_19170/g.30033  ORF Transcript_19170/g.30033 Transcript_19170/m.30033 type:complete len:177 (-) Transcript_19170:55-585(-)|eukprot:CAMPEP_0201541518 /NCGR_PEP_ID=MMETSP0161_2-20130828/71522_1 /ASSEMBLY_ACC=CAM_ASM_000251 /TAXON_ID=180227 /ORGANISM="Neoparamoeba aestuarina, Strain SoJaBio B1-5/56/2" /LENGTH=176 /DNA_ID=CAMNT_0047949061 /DNA_START=33 /DNA_END=563 /DNA_ORIENTATION=+